MNGLSMKKEYLKMDFLWQFKLNLSKELIVLILKKLRSKHLYQIQIIKDL